LVRPTHSLSSVHAPHAWPALHDGLPSGQSELCTHSTHMPLAPGMKHAGVAPPQSPGLVQPTRASDAASPPPSPPPEQRFSTMSQVCPGSHSLSVSQ